MEFLRRAAFILGFSLFLIPIAASASFAVPWFATSTDKGYITPILVNGNGEGIIVTASSTFTTLTTGLVGNNQGSLYSFASSSLFGYTPLNPTRAINTTWPLIGGGDLSADRTLTFGWATTSQPSSSNLFVSNGTNGFYGVGTTTASCSGNASCSSFTIIGSSPVTITASGGTGSGLSTSTPIAGSNLLEYSAAGAGSAYGVATSSLGVSGPITFSGTIGSQVGGVGGTFGCTSASSGVTGCLTGTDWNTFNAKQAPGFQIATSSGVSVPQLAYFTNANTTLGGVSTSTATINSPLTGTNFTVVGGSTSLGCQAASLSQAGCLAAADFQNFNNKVATSASETAGQLAVFGTTNGTPAKLYSIGTTSESITGPFVVPSTYGKLVGGTGSITYTGLATTSQPSSSNLLTSNGTNGVYGTATTTASCAGTVSCTTFTVLGSSPITLTGSGGSGGTGNVATSTHEATNQIAYFSSNSATPATIAGSNDFQWDDTNKILSLGTSSKTDVSIYTGAGLVASTTYYSFSAGSSPLRKQFYFDNTDSTYQFQKLGDGTAGSWAVLDLSKIATSNKTFTFPNLTGTFALGSYSTGFTSGSVPFGSSGLLATSSTFTFDGTRLNATYASSTAVSATTLCLSTDCRTVWPTSGGGSGTVGTSTHETAGDLSYWTTTSGTPALLGDVGTSSLSITGPFVVPSTFGKLVGGSGSVTYTGLATTSQPSSSQLLTSNGAAGVYGTGTSTLTASGPLTGSFTQVGSGGSLGCTTAAAGVAGCLNSTDWSTFNNKQNTISVSAPIRLTGAALDWTGLATTSQPSSSNLLVSNGAAGVYGVATSTLTASSPLTGSFAQVGSGGSLGCQVASASQAGCIAATDFSHFNSATTTFSTGLTYSLASNAVTVNTTQNLLKISGLTTNGFVQTSGGDGTLSSAALASAQVTTALGFTPFGGTNPLPIANGGTNDNGFTSNQLTFYNGTGLVSASSTAINNGGGFFGLGTSTPRSLLDLATSTGIAIQLYDGSVNSPWNMIERSGGLFFATSSLTTFATSTFSALSLLPVPSGQSQGVFVGTSSVAAFPSSTVGAFLNEPFGTGAVASSTLVIGETATTTSVSQIQLNNASGATYCIFVNGAGTLTTQSGKCN